MSIPMPPFDSKDVDVLTTETLYQGFFKAEKMTLRHRLYEGGWSTDIVREVFVRGEAVGIVLYDPVSDLIGLVEQIRIGAIGHQVSPWCLEVVAGMTEADESLVDVARREIQEETSLTPTSIEYICEYMASPGGSTERLHLFCGLVALDQAAGVHGLEEEGEDIKLYVLPAQTVFDELYTGRFNNAATLIGLQWLQINRSRILNEVTTDTELGKGKV